MADKYDGQHVGAMDIERFRTVAHRAVDMAADYLSSIRSRSVFTPMKPSERERLLLRRLPESSLTPESILEVFREEILAHPMGNGHPRFFGWVNSPPAPIGIVRSVGAGLDLRTAADWLQRPTCQPRPRRSVSFATCLAAGPNRQASLRVGQSGIDASGERADVVAQRTVGAVDHDRDGRQD